MLNFNEIILDIIIIANITVITDIAVIFVIFLVLLLLGFGGSHYACDALPLHQAGLRPFMTPPESGVSIYRYAVLTSDYVGYYVV